MNTNEIELKLQTIFREVLKDNSFILSHDLTPEDVEGWNSLAHAEIVLAIENSFGIKFSLKEMMNLDSVDGILKCLEKKLCIQ